MIIKKIKVVIKIQDGVPRSGNIIHSNYEKEIFPADFGKGIEVIKNAH